MTETDKKKKPGADKKKKEKKAVKNTSNTSRTSGASYSNRHLLYKKALQSQEHDITADESQVSSYASPPPSPSNLVTRNATDAVDVVTLQQVKTVPKPPKDPDNCPCGVKNKDKVWKIDCSQCKRYWHVDCLSMSGIKQDSINRMLDYLCPFCYIPPVSNVNPSPDICFTCKNTENVRNLALWEELKDLTESKDQIRSMNEDLGKLKKDLSGTMSDFSLLNTTSVSDESTKIARQKLEDEIQSLTDSLKSTKDDFDKVNTQISGAMSNLSSHSITSDEFMKSVEKKLDLLYSTEMEIKQELHSRYNTHHKGSSNSDCDSDHSTNYLGPSSTKSGPAAYKPKGKPPIIHFLAETVYHHGQSPIKDAINDFIDKQTEENLIELFEDGTFKQENGHSVLAYGEPYNYTGGKATGASSTMPPIINKLIDTVNDTFCKNLPPVNSCLVNKYLGNSSFLPQHSDNEVHIHPDSLILTVSLGEECEVNFIEMDAGTESTHPCKPRSLYSMTRKSQDIYQHKIKSGSINSGVRYSITLRSIDKLNRNSTCVLGDSNSCGLKFGEGRGTFGRILPGTQHYMPTIDKIDPYASCGYSNVVILCGINDIKHHSVNSNQKVNDCFDFLATKVNHIRHINPKANLIISPLLPTKS